jgi:hypothetical protein
MIDEAKESGKKATIKVKKRKHKNNKKNTQNLPSGVV